MTDEQAQEPTRHPPKAVPPPAESTQDRFPATVTPSGANGDGQGKTGDSVMVSPRSGAEVPTGAHPGNTGGKPGRSGRKTNRFHERALEVCNDDKAWDVVLARARAGDLKAMDLAASYEIAKPKQVVEVSGPEGGPIEQVWVFGKREIKF